jgi:hypothetical protein
MSDICCTSANAAAVVASIPADRPVIFIPDQSLGDYTAKQLGRELRSRSSQAKVHDALILCIEDRLPWPCQVEAAARWRHRLHAWEPRLQGKRPRPGQGRRRAPPPTDEQPDSFASPSRRLCPGVFLSERVGRFRLPALSAKSGGRLSRGRGPAPLTYEPGSACATLFGYLNVFLAAAALWTGRPRAEALALLTNEDRAALAFSDGEVRWGPSRFTADELARVRSEFALSVGSCSFSEPVSEIRQLGARLDRKESAG